MATVNIMCPICVGLFKNSESINATTCGHVFHANCLSEWRNRSTVCPTCRHPVGTSHRIYLNFEEGSVNGKDKEIAKLKLDIEKHIHLSSVLQQQLDQSEQEFLNLGAQYTNNDDEMKNLNEKVESLTLQNEKLSKSIKQKTTEIQKLQEALTSANPKSSTIMLQEEIKILKEKNKQINNELNKEIRNSTQLSVNKMKLESMLEQAKAMPPKSPLLPIPPPPQATTTSSKSKNERLRKPLSISQFNRFQTNRGCQQSVVIKDVKGTFADEDALKNYVIKLSGIMGLLCSREDLEEVTVLKRTPLNTMSLKAKFKSIAMKSLFLSRKERLKLDEETKNLLLHAYLGDNMNSLFHYAKTLKSVGFRRVYCHNDTIYAKKVDSDIPLCIRNHADVDKLISEA